MTGAGWFNDERDPALARWFDGLRWTDHTMVKAEWRGPGMPPPPPEDVTFPEPATVRQPALSEEPYTRRDERPAPIHQRAVQRYRGWPQWARVASPVAAGLVVLLAATSAGGEDAPARAETTGTTAVVHLGIDDAVTVAQTELALDVPDGDLEYLIRGLCSGDAEATATDAVTIDVLPVQVPQVLDAAAAGAEKHCPKDAPSALVPRVQMAVDRTFADATSTTTTVAPTSTAVPGATTTTRASGPATPTTKAVQRANPGTTATTAPAPVATSPATTPPTTPATTPATSPPAGAVNSGSFCSPVGKTGFESDGEPMTCSTTKCDTTPYEQPRWRKTNC